MRRRLSRLECRPRSRGSTLSPGYSTSVRAIAGSGFIQAGSWGYLAARSGLQVVNIDTVSFDQQTSHRPKQSLSLRRVFGSLELRESFLELLGHFLEVGFAHRQNAAECYSRM